MPLYEYKCHKCGKKFEALQKFSDAPLSLHEECGGEVERLISSPAFHFKGTGWYVTDYAKSNGVSTPAAEGAKTDSAASSEAKSESKTETKTESKPETKTESTPKPAPSSNSSSSDT